MPPESSTPAGIVSRAGAIWSGFRSKPNSSRILVASGIITVLLAGGATWAIVEAHKVVVPDLIGASVVGVNETARDADLVVEPRGPLPSADLRKFTSITSQEPVAGARVFPGEVIEFDFEMIDVLVPQISGLTLDEAQKKLAYVGLSARGTSAQIAFDHSTDLGGGIPSTTDPALLAAVVSELGLEDVDFEGGIFEVEPKSGRGYWLVIATDLRAGESVKAGAVIDVTLALPIAQVPSVTGKTAREAYALVEAAGLRPRSSDPVFAGTLPQDFKLDLDYLEFSYWSGNETSIILSKLGTPETWLITSQFLPAGDLILVGKDLGLTVSWPSATVPDLIHLSGPDAREALHAAGLSWHDISPTADGIVRSQTVAPGTVIPMGARVGADVRHEVTFSVTSSSRRGLITWIAPGSFSIRQENGAALPWSTSWYPASVPGRYDRGNFSAQNSGGGWITCAIVIDGQIVETNTSTGSYAVVSCG